MKGTETFKLTFNREYHHDKIALGYGIYVKITSPVTHIYGKGYHKLLYYITLKQRFIEGHKYSVKMIRQSG